MELTVTTRDSFGKANGALRKSGKIPAEFYGHGMANGHLAVDRKEFIRLFKEAGESTVITLLMDGKKQPSLVHDIQHDPVTGDITHIDFYGVRMDVSVRTMIPLEFTGEAPAVKEKGAVITKAVSEVEVEALPGDLPHGIAVDISGLAELEQSIYVRDLVVPKNVKILTDLDTAIVIAAAPAPEEEIPPPPIDVADVKVETEEKKAERDAGKEAEQTNA